MYIIYIVDGPLHTAPHLRAHRQESITLVATPSNYLHHCYPHYCYMCHVLTGRAERTTAAAGAPGLPRAGQGRVGKGGDVRRSGCLQRTEPPGRGHGQAHRAGGTTRYRIFFK